MTAYYLAASTLTPTRRTLYSFLSVGKHFDAWSHTMPSGLTGSVLPPFEMGGVER